MCVQAYEHMLFAKAVEAGYYVLQNARDEYRLACGPDGMHRQLVQDYMRVSGGWASSTLAQLWPLDHTAQDCPNPTHDKAPGHLNTAGKVL